MNVSRLLVGGLVAGLVFNVLGMASAVLFDLETAFARADWTPEPATPFIHLGMRFLLGVVAVFVYAAMRSRFGAGPRTAAIVGVVLWFVGYLLPGMLLAELGIFEGMQAIYLLAWGFLEAPIATMSGAWLYRE